MGETMVVFIAAGKSGGSLFETDPLQPGLTMTAGMASLAAGTDSVVGEGLTFQSLFFVGLAFGYFLVLPSALGFLIGYDAELYNRQVQAGDYYSFVVTILIACGLIFQLPTGVFVLSTVGLMRSAWMRRHRRYAIFGMSIVAAALPGGDVVSMLIIFAALLGLYEVSIYVALFVERRKGAESDLPEEATTELDAAGGEA
jgi:Sec-independent protein secretion pathway component TatC